MQDPTLRPEIETIYGSMLSPKDPRPAGPRTTPTAAPPGPLTPALMDALVRALSPDRSAPTAMRDLSFRGKAKRVLGAARSGFEEVYADPLGINDETARSWGIGPAGQNGLNAYLGRLDFLSRLPQAGAYGLVDAGGQILRETGAESADQFVRDHKAMVQMVRDFGLKQFRR